jgi:monoamine oxidase
VLYAGEAAHERGSTVDSALESGRRAAAELVDVDSFPE